MRCILWNNEIALSFFSSFCDVYRTGRMALSPHQMGNCEPGSLTCPSPLAKLDYCKSPNFSTFGQQQWDISLAHGPPPDLCMFSQIRILLMFYTIYAIFAISDVYQLSAPFVGETL